ncbi:hypothetical protein A2334_04135 [Candidatus Roizmanbacteria bacterium RIFOXYB2_FULL_38_10]|uniref:DUF2029 domain-containing protein n=1 Tax=Candidatus Roizmanbacteria bacterium RIFOXYD1_FULL_38_12 TaxID=1802093 RepID=A0A1F7KZL0_9BACT|nr:MAG: hypothetical protein A3K47_00245 [Candidatus Roizmanbacteria bacterium RIFOXYA2_FULL_38_14]OGK63231.1 MAG: hypothetical protein A3K27_00245 [Candidatus Roizmanbacteria bacterium RIFOXYA1_FULL_37_12]OGK65077.1 MAG: hypothetical protein A3K38_00245 [Candidatus Roizmanbacteria bacterium RIFOXYB1_FULL_40_23]OGK68631.1 MAG: hypothetical protein A2334_04135 [Candidatus Roizmanbacteria bacterium RIFOXYB2_FULL_38_10]OGK69481.1 MAG: hypothetical protein A3K21_00245 [Candidatus Roizmanbacteria ba
MIFLFYFFQLFAFFLYSFFLIDPNITFIQNRYWVQFRDAVVQVGYYQREVSWYIYLVLVVLFFIFHYYFVRNYKKINLNRLVLLIGTVLLFSYPFLSHDFFNYMFDAKIFTFYHQNPYLQRALDYPSDQWTRFMHWTHRTYPYGPIFLLLSFIPSFLGFGKFTPTFLLFKAMFVGFYLLAVFFLNKLDKKWAIIFATHPLILIEGLISSHNDLIALCLAVIGIFFLLKRTQIWGRLFLLFSFAIKYITVPLLLLLKQDKDRRTTKWNLFISILQFGVIAYLCYRMEIQPWYFLTLFTLLPFIPWVITKLDIFFFGLLMSYYPYIRLGGWDTVEKVDIKHIIITVFFILNIVFIGIAALLKRRSIAS